MSPTKHGAKIVIIPLNSKLWGKKLLIVQNFSYLCTLWFEESEEGEEDEQDNYSFIRYGRKEKQKIRVDKIAQMVTTFSKEKLGEKFEQLCGRTSSVHGGRQKSVLIL